jgi:large repetitive protein
MGRARRQAVQMVTIALAILFCTSWAAAQCPNIEFLSAGNFGIGGTSSFAIAGDFNRDGLLDVAVANTETNTISIFLAQGSGSLSQPQNISLSINPRFIVTGDFNDDGFLDLVVSSSNSTQIAFLAGRSSGFFDFARAIKASSVISAIVTADFNRDGLLDFATANGSTNSISLFLGRGNFSFRRPFDFELGISPTFMTSVDFNRDGIVDLAVSNETTNNLFIMLGQANGSFGEIILANVGANIRTIALADFNADNLVDVVVVSPTSNRVFILLSHSDSTLSLPVALEVGANPSSVVVGDLNSDGNPDLAVTNRGSNSVSVLFSRGDGSFCPAANFSTENLSTTGTPDSIFVADLDGDNDLDLLIVNTNGTVSVLLNTSTCAAMRIAANGILEATAGASFNRTLFVTGGGTAPFNFSVVSGLPAGLTLSGVGELSGTPTVEGTFTFRVRVQDASGCDVTQNMVLRVTGSSGGGGNGGGGSGGSSGCPTITVVPPSLSDMTVGSNVNLSFSAVGSNSTVTFSSTGNMPGGLTLNSNGTLTGTVTETGSFHFNVTATDANGCRSAIFNVTLNVNCPTISINVPDMSNITVGSSVDATFTATGSNGTVTFSASGLPSGMSLSATGRLTGTMNTTGTVSFTVTATDQFGCSSAAVQVNINVGCPTITVVVPNMSGITAGTDFSFNFGATGATGNMTFTATGLPAGVTLSANGTLSGKIDSTGSFTFSVKAVDSNGCASASTTVTINVNINCTAINIQIPDMSHATAGRNINEKFSATGGSGEFTFSASGLPSGLTMDADGRLQGKIGASGEVTFTVTATDTKTGCASTVTVKINVACPNLKIIVPQMKTITAGGSIDETFKVTGNETVVFTATGLPAGLTLSTDGRLSGTVNVSTDVQFTVTATGEFGCKESETVTIDVECPNLTVGPTTLPTVSQGSTINQQLTVSGGGSGSFNFEVVAGGTGLPAGVSLSSSGLLSGTVNGAGSFTFTVKVTDTVTGCSVQQTIMLQVGCATITISPTTLPDVIFGTNLNLSLSASGGTGTYTFSLVSGELPAGVTLNSNGTLTGTVTGVGRFFFTVKATDANGCSGQAEINLPVLCTAMTITGPTTVSGTVGTSLNTSYSVSGATTATVNFSVEGTLPQGVSFTGGALVGIPLATGTFTINLKATDANNCASAVLQVTITINAP